MKLTVYWMLRLLDRRSRTEPIQALPMWASLRRAVRVARTWALGGIAVALSMLNGSDPNKKRNIPFGRDDV